MEMGMNSVQPNAQFPVPHKSLSLDINGNKTDIVISKYEDSFMVMVTQIGCMGAILVARKDESVFSDPTYNVSVLFGKRDEVSKVIILFNVSGSGSARSLMISHGLKDHSQATMKYIVSTIIENRLW
uniref:Uncharacterized protein n=1 Tax=Oryza meridionalis TaxID=40149 RepID=A0A0E0C1G4_9ORYZ